MVERIAAEREGVIGCWTSSSLGGGLRYGDMAHDQFAYDVLKLSRTLGRRLRQRVREGLIQLCGEATVAMVEDIGPLATRDRNAPAGWAWRRMTALKVKDKLGKGTLGRLDGLDPADARWPSAIEQLDSLTKDLA